MRYDSSFVGFSWGQFGGKPFPGTVDDSVKDAICLCWSTAPKDRKTIAYVESAIRRMTEQVLKEFKQDPGAFGVPKVE